MGFWGFGVLGFWGFGVLGFWGFGDVKGTNILEDDYAPEYSQDIIEWKSDYVILRFKPYQIITLRILLVTQDL